MAELPTGTVTLLFSDIEGSTRLLARLGDRYVEVLAEHRRLLRASFARFNGREVGTEGDAFFIAFDKASEAVAGQAGAGLVAQLLELLTTFIGEALTLRLIRDSWPDASMDGANLRGEEKP